MEKETQNENTLNILDYFMANTVGSRNDIYMAARAKMFATIAHESIHEKGRFVINPRINHLCNVANILNDFGYSHEIVAAAYLHDILDDVFPRNDFFSEERILYYFDDFVCRMVCAVTKSSWENTDDMDSRERRDRERLLASRDRGAFAIKVADLIDNTRAIVSYDKNCSKILLEKNKLLLDEIANIGLINKHLLDLGYVTWKLSYDLLRDNWNFPYVTLPKGGIR